MLHHEDMIRESLVLSIFIRREIITFQADVECHGNKNKLSNNPTIDLWNRNRDDQEFPLMFLRMRFDAFRLAVQVCENSQLLSKL